VLIGGNKITQERMDRAMKKQLAATAQAQGRQLDFPDHHFYTESTEANGFSLSVGAGIERKLNGALALRIAGFDYSRSWMRPLEGMDRSANLRLTTGLVLRMGTW
jgi:hypothetical protein